MECPQCDSLLGPGRKHIKGQSYCHVCRVKWHRCPNGVFTIISEEPFCCECEIQQIQEIRQTHQTVNNSCACIIS